MKQLLVALVLSMMLVGQAPVNPAVMVNPQQHRGQQSSQENRSMQENRPMSGSRRESLKDILTATGLDAPTIQTLLVAYATKEKSVQQLKAKHQNMLRSRSDEAGKTNPDPAQLKLLNADALAKIDAQVEPLQLQFHMLLLSSMTDTQKHLLLEKLGL